MKYIYSLFFILYSLSAANAAKVVASVNGNSITDIDITQRVKIMKPALNNRELAMDEIISDYIKLEYAKQFGIEPPQKDIKEALKGDLSNPQAVLAAKSALSWQMVVGRTIIPQISLTDADIAEEIAELERLQGLPYDMKFIRVVSIPKKIYEKLTKPDSCETAREMVRELGGDPQVLESLQYELSDEIRQSMADLELLTWSPRTADGETYLICSKTKGKEWTEMKLDAMIRQNALYRRALFQADQILKQYRRKAVITGF